MNLTSLSFLVAHRLPLRFRSLELSGALVVYLSQNGNSFFIVLSLLLAHEDIIPCLAPRSLARSSSRSHPKFAEINDDE